MSSDELIFDGRRFISAADAADSCGLHRDYIARLARVEKISARRVGKNWYVEVESLKQCLFEQDRIKEIRKQELAKLRKQEYTALHTPEVVVPVAVVNEMPVVEIQQIRVPEPARIEAVKAVSPLPVLSFEPEVELTSEPTSSSVPMIRKSLARAVAGKTPAVKLAQVAPLYAVSPMLDFVHKASALITAITLVLGTYAFADWDTARPIVADARAHFKSATSATVAFVTHPDFGTDSAPTTMQLAAAEISVAGRFESLAKKVNTRVDDFVFGIVFSNARTFAVSRGSVSVTVVPVSRAVARTTSPVIAPMPLPTSNTLYIDRTISVAGVTKAYVDQGLASLRSDFLSRLSAMENANSTTFISLASSGGSGSSNVDLSNVTITGGTISGVTITGGSVTATAFSGVLPIVNGGTATSASPTYGQLLIGDGAGGYTLVATSSLNIIGAASSPGGSSGAVQFNNAGTFAGENEFSYNSSTNLLSVAFASTTAFTATTLCLGSDCRNAWPTGGDGFSTTSASYFTSLGLAFSTTSANYWETQQTARSADDLTNNSIEDLNDVAAMTENYGDLFAWNGSTWTDFATSSLAIALSDTTGTLGATRGGTGLSSITAAGILIGNYSGTGWQQLATSTLGLLTTHVAEGSNLYYTNARVQTYLDTLAKGYFFSTTSAQYFASQGLAFSTTSADYYISQANLSGFSTTSADYWKTARNFFSTTSADYWETTQVARTADDLTNNSIEDLNDVAAITENYGDLFAWNGSTWTDFATSSLAIALSDTTGTLGATRGGTGLSSITAAGILLGNYSGTGWMQLSTSTLGLLTTNVAEGSNLYYTDARVQTYLDTIAKGFFFSTTSASHFASQGLAFSTTSAQYFLAQNQGASFSTTSAIYFANASTTIPKTYSNNVFTGTNTFANATSSNFAITSLLSCDLKTNSDGTVYCGTDATGGGASFGESWNIRFGALTPTTTLGVIVAASSTIGSGNQDGGLTISGGATTTGNQYVAGGLRVATAGSASTPSLAVGAVNTGFFSAASRLDITIAGTNTHTFWSDSSLYLNNNSAWLQIGASSPAILTRSANNTLRLSSDGGTGSANLVVNGTIGIGTTSPYRTLSVLGDGVFTGSLATANLTATGTVAFTGLSSGFVGSNNGTLYSFSTSTLGFLGSYDAWTHPAAGQSATTSLMLFSGGASSTLLSVTRGAYFGTTATSSFDSAGNLSMGGNITFGTDNTYNIGSSGANRPRDIFVSHDVTAANQFIAPNFTFASNQGYFTSQSDGVFTFFNNAGTSFGRLQLGGTTASFPSIKRNGTGIDFRLADDSAYANINSALASSTNLFVNTTATTTNLAVTGITSSLLKTNSLGQVVAATPGTDYANFGYLFPSNATTTGLGIYASSTIGAGGQTTGLTISGGATTTGAANFLSHIYLSSTGVLGVNGNGSATSFAGVGTLQNSTTLRTGIYVSSDDVYFKGNSSDQARFVNGGGFRLRSDGYYAFSSAANVTSSNDTAISRYGAGVLAIGTGTAGNTAGGFLAMASSTIGSGAQAGGLTISGGATTTGNAYFAGNTSLQQATSTTLGITGLTSSLLYANASGSILEIATSTLAINTTDLIEGNGLFFTDERVDDRVGALLQAGTGVNLNYDDNANTLTISSTGGGGGGSDVNWTYFNGSGIRPSTTTNQVVIGGSSTSTLANPLAKLGVIGGASFDYATSSTFFSASLLANTARFGATATSSFSSAGVLTLAGITSSLLKTDGSNNVVAAVPGVDYMNSATKDWNVVGGTSYIAPTTTLGMIVNASSTIGNGTQTGGLTISGGATTTGNAYIAGNLTIDGTDYSSSFITLYAPAANRSLYIKNADNGAGGLWVGSNTANPYLYYDPGNTRLVLGSSAGYSWSNSSSAGGTVDTGFSRGAANKIYAGNGTASDYSGTLIAGTIGIGTTSPFAALSVAGNGFFNGNLTSANLTATGTVAFTGLGSGFVGSNGGTLYTFATSTLGFLSSYDAFTHPAAGQSATTSLMLFNGGASSTLLSANRAYFGGTATTTIDAAGNLSVAGTLAVTGNTTLANATSTNLALTNVTSSLLKTNSSGSIVPAIAGTDYLAGMTFGEAWNMRFGALTPTTTLGVLVSASSTIGAGGQTTGLTISGGATTTGNAYVGGSLNLASGNTFQINGTSVLSNNTLGSGVLTSSLTAVGALTSGSLASGFGSISISNAISTASCGAAGSNTTCSNGQFYVVSGAGTRPVLRLDGASGGNTADIIQAYSDVGNTRLLTLTAAGNLGLGTSTPYSKITTWGTGQLFEAVNNASTTIFSIGQTGATTTNFAISGITSSLLKTNANGSIVPAIAGTDYLAGMTFGEAWNIRFGALTPTTTLGVLVSASSTIGSGAQAGGLTISGGATTTGNAYFGGNIGIGTSTPGSKLVIQDSANAEVRFVNSGASGRSYSWNSYADGKFYLQDNTNNTTPILISSATDITIGGGSAGVNFVNGNTIFANNHGILIKDSGSTARDAMYADTSNNLVFGSQSYNWNSIGFYGGSATPSLILKSGNVGIGTTTPYSKFSVLGDGVFTGSLGVANLTATGTVAFTGIGSGFVGSNGGTLYTFATSTLGFLASYDAWTHPAAGQSATTSLMLFNGGASSTLLSANRAWFGGTATSSFDTAGNSTIGNNLNVTGQTTLATSLTGLLKATSGVVSTATAGVDYISSSYKDWNVVGGTSYIAPTTTLGILVNASSTIGNGTATGGLTISGGATTTGNTVLQGTLAVTGNTTLANATSTNLALTNVTSSLLKTNSSGSIIPAIGGTDYANFGYLFPSAATTTTLTFSGGLVSVGSTTINGNATTTGMFGAGSLFVNNERFTDLTGSGLSILSNALTVNDVTADMLANADFGDFTCNGTTCALDADTVSDSEIDYSTVTLADFTNDASYVTGTGGANRLAYWSGASALTSSASFTFDGTTLTAPDALISTSGTARLSINDSSSSGTDFRIDVASGGATFTADVGAALSGEFFAFATNNDEKVRITESGRLGIGTTTPGAALSVVGGIFASSTATSTFQGGGINLLTAAGNTGCFAINGTCVGAGGGGSGDITAVGSMLTGDAFADSSADDDWLGLGASAGRIEFDDQTVDEVNILGANLGVGTTSPWAKLSVDASSLGSAPAFSIGSTTSSLFVVNNAGQTIIGNTTAFSSSALTVNGFITSTSSLSGFVFGDRSGGNGFQWYSQSGSANLYNMTNSGTPLTINSSGNLGIGTTTPFRKLSLTDAVSTAQQVIAYDTTRYTDMLTDASGDFTINPSGNDILATDENLWVCTGGCPATAPAGTGNLIVETAVGIGTSSPGTKLEVYANQASVFDGLRINNADASGNGARLTFAQGGAGQVHHISSVYDATGGWQMRIGYSTNNQLNIDDGGNVGIGSTTPSRQLSVGNTLYVGANGALGMGTATSTFQGDIKIIGKLDVSTIDPPYTIDGTKYATYVPSMTGVKEETVATIQLDSYNAKTGKYEAVIAFDDLEKGSDLWLFYQITTFGDKWKELVVQLTPAFDGQVFYKKDVSGNKLVISGTEEGEVSMRLTAARYDDAKWPNLRPDQDGNTEGTHVISSKPKGGETAAETAEVREAKGMLAAVATATAALTHISEFATSTIKMATSTLMKLFAWLR